jgi:hypothetical protein
MAHDDLADIIESHAESCVMLDQGHEFDVLLFVAPLLAWSRFSIPAASIPKNIVQTLKVQLGAHLFANGARIALAERTWELASLRVLGFTRAEVELALDTMFRDRPDLAADPRMGQRNELMNVLETYYNGYRFSRQAKDRMYNSTLVLHFLREVLRTGSYPEKMLDLNVRTDYGRLYQIAKSTSEKDRDTRDLLEEILTQDSVCVELVEQFGTKLHIGRAQVASLFFYMGMLTFADDAPAGEESKLVIPNRVMRDLQWEYMAFALMDHDDIRLSMGPLQVALGKLSREGLIEPLVEVFKEDVVKRLGLRETMTFNEQTMKLMLFAYLSQTKAFYLRTEFEAKQGYCDLLLGVRGPHSSGKYAWIIEAKYVEAKATKSKIDAVVEKGYQQIDKYASDKDVVVMLTESRELRAGVLVFVGLKDVKFFSWPRPAEPAVKKAARNSRKTRKAASA